METGRGLPHSGVLFRSLIPLLLSLSLAALHGADQFLRVAVSIGHASPKPRSYYLKLSATEGALAEVATAAVEAGDTLSTNQWNGQAGGADVDHLQFLWRVPERSVTPITNLHSIWTHLLIHGDPEAASRLKSDPAHRPDSRKLTLALNSDSTRGFSLTADQLLRHRSFWVPDLDLFLSLLSTNDAPLPAAACAELVSARFAEHKIQLSPKRGLRILDQIEKQPESTYEEFTARWEDMGAASYRNPHAPAPGHIICLGWDSALYKFGIDRLAGVWSDYSKIDPLRFTLRVGGQSDPGKVWKSQKLIEGLPIVVTSFEEDGVRWEIEQFVIPLREIPAHRRGDIPMVLRQSLRITETAGRPRNLPLLFELTRQSKGSLESWVLENTPAVEEPAQPVPAGVILRSNPSGRLALGIRGAGLLLSTHEFLAGKWETNRLTFALQLPANASRTFTLSLPSPQVEAADAAAFDFRPHAIDRMISIQFWKNWLAQGALFSVPEEPVNTLFRASLWHSLRLPRRHGGEEPNVRIDLPYSNFAYDQNGTPWPVNQAIYVDSMIYDARGYHAVSAEELAVIYRNNQAPDGQVKGFANWGVYTPSMIYSVARHFLLSGDRASFESLLPQTLKAIDWCLAERTPSSHADLAPGLILAPLNDLSHDAKAWAFNQAYFYACLDLIAQALQRIDHPRSGECRQAADSLHQAIERAFGRASTQSPLIQLRDESWIPYVPADALTPQRLLNVWYPTDVDTGALHLSRLKALDPTRSLTSFLLHDHEDNLFINNWGMANEPVYNQQATAYLLRDHPKHVIRSFYSMLACAFSHSTFESVEHRWGWGQYFCPPSTDGAWFDLYRNMLIHETSPDSLLLCQATPRKWLEPGKEIKVERAPTYFGPISFTVRSAPGQISALIDPPNRPELKNWALRLRSPNAKAIRSVVISGQPWKKFDPAKEQISLPVPEGKKLEITIDY